MIKQSQIGICHLKEILLQTKAKQFNHSCKQQTVQNWKNIKSLEGYEWIEAILLLGIRNGQFVDVCLP